MKCQLIAWTERNNSYKSFDFDDKLDGFNEVSGVYFTCPVNHHVVKSDVFQKIGESILKAKCWSCDQEHEVCCEQNTQ